MDSRCHHKHIYYNDRYEKKKRLTMTNQDFTNTWEYVHKFLGVIVNMKQIR